MLSNLDDATNDVTARLSCYVMLVILAVMCRHLGYIRGMSVQVVGLYRSSLLFFVENTRQPFSLLHCATRLLNLHQLGLVLPFLSYYAPQLYQQVLVRARISYGDSVCLSGVSLPGTEPSPGEIETPGLHHMIP